MHVESKFNGLHLRMTDAGTAVQGIAVVEREVTYMDDGTTEHSSRYRPPRPISLSDVGALGEIGVQIQAASLVAVAELQAQVQALTAEREQFLQQRNEAAAQRDATMAIVDALRAQYESPVLADGVPAWVYRVQAIKAMIDTPKASPWGATFEDYVLGILRAAAAQSIEGRMMLADFLESARFYRNHASTLKMIQQGILTAAEADALWKKAYAIATVPGGQ